MSCSWLKNVKVCVRVLHVGCVTHIHTSLSCCSSAQQIMEGSSFVFLPLLLLFAWMPASGSCKPKLSLLMCFDIWCTDKSDKYPQAKKKQPLSTASYALPYLSFYDHIMCSHMKHVWLRNDEWQSIRYRCAGMWQGQTIQSMLVLKIWIINVRLCSCTLWSITFPLKSLIMKTWLLVFIQHRKYRKYSVNWNCTVSVRAAHTSQCVWNTWVTGGYISTVLMKLIHSLPFISMCQQKASDI